MKAMILNQLCAIADNNNPLVLVDMPDPVPRDNEILVKVSTCGVCHTELDEIEDRTPSPNPLKSSMVSLIPPRPGNRSLKRWHV